MGWILGQEDPLEEGTATHSGILAWRAPWTQEPGGLQATESQSRTRLKRLSTHANWIFSSSVFSYQNLAWFRIREDSNSKSFTML